MDVAADYFRLPFRTHIAIGVLLRVACILYGEYHDRNNEVSFTDIDYRVFTDAARHIVSGNSPYKRHTYRYSPIIAFLMIPNVLLHKTFGKYLFSIFDICITVAIKQLVAESLKVTSKVKPDLVENISSFCSYTWLYNPLALVISARGNADSFPCFIIILSIFFLQTRMIKSDAKYLLSGLFLGVAIHLRLYPLAFSFPMYLSLVGHQITRNSQISADLLVLVPNRKQIFLTMGCVLTLVMLTLSMHSLYGYDFLFETYIYHFIRNDIRHNFSLAFYTSYLNTALDTEDVVKVIVKVAGSICVVSLSVAFGLETNGLVFGLFAQSVAMVAYNSVITSQYFVWSLSLLPLCIHQINMVRSKAIGLSALWILAQMAWLFNAYLLEFKSKDMYIYIWLQSVVFFCTNIYILSELIRSFRPDFAFGYGRMSNLKFQ